MADSAQDRQLPASQRKIEKARADGQLARSRDLGHFAAIAGMVALIVALAPALADWLTQILSAGLRFDASQIAHPEQMSDRLLAMSLKLLTILAPLFFTMLTLAMASSLLSGGWNFTLKPLQPDFSKFNPLTGLARVFSGQQLTGTLKACLLAVLLGAVGAVYLMARWSRHAQLLAMPLPAALHAGGVLLQDGVLLLCALLAAFALVDVPLQRAMMLRRLRMSPEERKREAREQEGNAEVKGLMRRRMREMANKRMMAQVPLADLVVMNPSHYAVALKYDEATMNAPRLVAKGADLMALRIRDLARESGVPVLQAPPLARALYAHAELDQEIPTRLFGAVAQVLAWVYQLREAMASGRASMADVPAPEVPADLDPLNRPAASPDAPSAAQASPGASA